MVFSAPKFSINNLLTESSVMNNLLSPTNSMCGAETIRLLFRSKPNAYKNTTAISISTNRMLFQFSFFIFVSFISLIFCLLKTLSKASPFLRYHQLQLSQQFEHQKLKQHC